MKPDEPIPLARPDLGPREEELVLEALRAGRLSLGPMLDRFERDFAAWLGTEDAVAVSSGTAALHLDRVTLNLDPEAAAAAVTERTVGLLPVHIFGYPAAMPELERIARERGLGVLEDAAEATGAVDAGGVKVGTRGNIAIFAFYANKQLVTGEGGIAVPSSPDVAALMRSERNQGRAPGMDWLGHERLGFNYRLTELQAALGIAQLERLDALLAGRARVAALYADALAKLGGTPAGEGDPDGLVLSCSDRGSERRSWFLYIVQLPAGVDRDAVIARLAERGVDSKAYLPCIHLMPHYRERFGFREGQFPVAETVSRRTLALPFFVAMSEAEVQRVADALGATLGRP
jgi:perosamine synthetase